MYIASHKRYACSMNANKLPQNTAKRSECPIAALLDLVGDRWSLLVIRDVGLFGKHRNKDFQQGAEGIPSNILADRLKRLVADGLVEKRLYQEHPPRYAYHLTESGFGADIGFEKFWNVKCRYSGNTPNVSVITATIRALKSHGTAAGAPIWTPGSDLTKVYSEENLAWLEDGAQNLVHHINTVKKAGIGLTGVGASTIDAAEASAALVGSTLQPDAVEAAATLAAEASQPRTDHRGSADYKRHVIATFVRRILAYVQRTQLEAA